MGYALKIYSPDVRYSEGDCIELDGRYFAHNGLEFVPLVVRDSLWGIDTGPPGPPGRPGPPGIAGRDGRDGIDGQPGKSIIFSGEWSPRQTYAVGSAVQYRGYLFIALQENRARRPSRDGNQYWGMAAKRGLRGRTGERGERGAMGPRGFRGSSGEDLRAETLSSVAGSAIEIGMVLRATDSGVELAQANNPSNARAIGLAISAAQPGNSVEWKTEGTIQRDSWTAVSGTAALIAGATYYLSAGTAGRITHVAPVSDGALVVPVARALTTDTLDIEVSTQGILL